MGSQYIDIGDRKTKDIDLTRGKQAEGCLYKLVAN